MKITFFILGILMLVNIKNLPAQTPALLSSSMVVHVPVDSPVVYRYLLDISAVPFTTPDQMEIFFIAHRDEVIDFVINKTDRSVYMLLNPDYIIAYKWTTEDINKHLESKAVKMRGDYITLPVDVEKK